MTRSWWGWGNVEDALSESETRDLTARCAALLPDHDFTDHAPPDPDQLELPSSRITPPAPLAGLCSSDPTDRAGHARGKAFRDVVLNLRGRLDNVPDLIARPRSEQDVIDILDWCTRESIAVIPYGGGSSVVGGVEPRFDGPAVTMDLTGMGAVLEVDAVSRAARIQAGALGPQLEDQLRPHGVTLRHFPQSFGFSTLGGWLATRAGGHFATLYTHIDDLTESVRVVTPAGISESRRLPGSGAGPSPDRMFLGSEGALGVITEAWMRLQDRPRWHTTASITFDDWITAVSATRAIAQAGLYPTNCRLLDPAEAFLNASTSVSGGLLVAGIRIRRPSRGCVGGPGTGDCHRTPRHRHRPTRARGRDQRCVDHLAVVVSADALPARRTRTPQCHRRDLRNRLHLGQIRRPARRREPRCPRRCRTGLRGGSRQLPVHPRLPGRPGPLLRRLRRRTLGRPRRAVG